MYSATAIVPTLKFTSAAAQRVVDAALDQTADEVESYYESSVSRWKTKVTFFQQRLTNERVIGTNSLVFVYNDENTRPHRINPRYARALRFKGRSGKIVFSKTGVNHPGTTGKKISQGIARQIQPVLLRRVNVGLQGVAQ